MSTNWTTDYAFEKLIQNIDTIDGMSHSNEATTRMRVIDTIIFDVLGWDKLCVESEKYVREAGYADYCFRINSHISLVIEAKKESDFFLLPKRKYNETPFGFGLLAEECKEAYCAMIQASGYATTLGSRYIAISNGHQWLMALSFVPNQPMNERLVYVFESIDAIKMRFQFFWDCFSCDAIRSNTPVIGLSESRKNPAPTKLSTTIPGYPLPIERNHLKNEISFVLSSVWDGLNSKDESVDFLEHCYIIPDSSKQEFSLAKEMIKERSSDDEELSKVHLPVSKAPQFIKEYPSERPIVVLGEVGHGKSTFLKYLRLIVARKELEKYIQLDINFLDNPEDHKEVPSYIFKEIIHQLLDRYGIDITENKFVRAALNAEINRFHKSPRGQAFPPDTDEYKMSELQYIEEFQRDHHEYLKRTFSHIRGSHGKSIAIFFDNLDRRSDEIQEEAFLRASSMARDWSALIFVCLRPSTFYRSRKSGVLDSIATKVFTISAPDSTILLKKRFQYGIEVSQGGENITKRTSVKLPTVSDFLRCCIESLKNKELVSLFDSVSNGNARNLLQYTKKIITNNHLDTNKIVKIMKEQGGYTIAAHEAERSLLFGDYEHYDPKRSVFINLFDIRHSDPIEYFCKILILDFLNRSPNSGINHGYCRLNDIVDYASHLGYSVDYAKEMLSELLLAKYCATNMSQEKLNNIDDLIRITSLGRYHLNVLLCKVTYIDAVIIDTPIVDESVRVNVKDVKPISERLDRSEIFLSYIDSCSEHIQDVEARRFWLKISNKAKEEIIEIRKKTKP